MAEILEQTQEEWQTRVRYELDWEIKELLFLNEVTQEEILEKINTPEIPLEPQLPSSNGILI